MSSLKVREIVWPYILKFKPEAFLHVKEYYKNTIIYLQFQTETMENDATIMNTSIYSGRKIQIHFHIFLPASTCIQAVSYRQICD
jgi:hypothetical protein